MKTDAQYRAELIAHQQPLPPTRVPLAQALGCITAEPVLSRHPIPLFDNSAMDGYAVLATDVAAASPTAPVTLPVVTDIPAGRTSPTRIGPGQAARIMTGAPMPAGADGVVPVELTDGGTERVRIVAPAGDHVRAAGGDLPARGEITGAGVRLSARHLAAIASGGHSQVLVHPLPRVAVIATGSELRSPGEELTFGQIPNSNSTLIAASLSGRAHVQDLGTVPDEAPELRGALENLEADAVILTGGVSVGAYDVVKELLAAEPGMWFGPVAMQPGKPQGFGHHRGMSVFTLPGNPVSVYVSLHMLVRPALDRLAGAPEPGVTFTAARAAAEWRCPPGRVQYMPVRISARTGGEIEVVPASHGGSGSHLVGTLARAEGLARVEADVEQVRPGDLVEFWEEQ